MFVHGRTRVSPVPYRLCLFVLLAACSDPARAAESGAAWADRIEKALNGHKQPKAVLAARVVDLSTGRVLFERAADRPMIPASNMKLVVVAAALDQLGPDATFATILAVRGSDLVVIGGGDPTFGDEVLCKARGKPITFVFHEWAERLASAGVKQVSGDLVIDDSIFDGQFTHPNWPPDQQQRWYEAPIGGLNFNANCVEIRVSPTEAGQPAKVSASPGNSLLRIVNNARTGPNQTVVIDRRPGESAVIVSGTVARSVVLGELSVADPGMYFAGVMKTTLAAKGIAVRGKVRRERVRRADGSLPPECRVVAVHRAALRDAALRAGRDSLGMTAEGLLKLLGVRAAGVGGFATGRAAVKDFLTKAGAECEGIVIDDGSGLSKTNRLTPRATTDVLSYIAADAAKFAVLRESLARPGRRGTLEKRMRDPATLDRVFAKTGYVKGVCTLAGYIQTRSGKWLAFAFYYNNAPGTASLKAAQDNACKLLVDYPGN